MFGPSDECFDFLDGMYEGRRGLTGMKLEGRARSLELLKILSDDVAFD